MSGERLPGYGSGPVPPGARRAPGLPAPPPQRGELAGWGRRVVATLIDGVVVGAGAALVLAVVVALGLGVDTGGGAVAYVVFALVVVGALVVASLLYAPALMARTDGQTLGRMAVGIRVVRADGRAMDFGWATLREVVVKVLAIGVAASFTFGLAWLLDVLWPLWDPQKRALHDLVVDTRVVRT